MPIARGLLARLRRSPRDEVRALGRSGERAAARKLRKAGYRVLRRNVQASMGEMDLVCLAPDGRTIVFVEVKTRRISEAGRSSGFAPEVAIDPGKRRRLVALSQSLARRWGWTDRPLRIDAVAVEWPARGKPRVRHLENAVTL